MGRFGSNRPTLGTLHVHVVVTGAVHQERLPAKSLGKIDWKSLEVTVPNPQRLINRLVELGKDFDMVFYPNRTHAIAEGSGTLVHRWRTVARYFLEHLPPSGTPAAVAPGDSRP
jgi:hypothetical protein